MPANVVKTPTDERHWRAAKKAYDDAVSNGKRPANKWAYVMEVFQKMKGGSKAESMAAALEALASELPDQKEEKEPEPSDEKPLPDERAIDEMKFREHWEGSAGMEKLASLIEADGHAQQYSFRTADGPMFFSIAPQNDGSFKMAFLGDDAKEDWGGQDFVLPSSIDERLKKFDALWTDKQMSATGLPMVKSGPVDQQQVDALMGTLQRIFRDMKPRTMDMPPSKETDLSLNSVENS